MSEIEVISAEAVSIQKNEYGDINCTAVDAQTIMRAAFTKNGKRVDQFQHNEADFFVRSTKRQLNAKFTLPIEEKQKSNIAYDSATVMQHEKLTDQATESITYLEQFRGDTTKLISGIAHLFDQIGFPEPIEDMRIFAQQLEAYWDILDKGKTR